MRAFVSSTYEDLTAHRQAVRETILRTQCQLASMEDFGSRTAEVTEACMQEIERCDILIGIYAWRYGWQPTTDEPSIVEQEFRHALYSKRRCLCYEVDEDHPWPPRYIDKGVKAERLESFKREQVGQLVRSTFTTPDDLAKKVMADLAREVASPTAKDSFGGLVSVNWDVFSSDLQQALMRAYTIARKEAEDGVVATEHVLSAMGEIPSTASPLMASFCDRVPLLQTDRALPDPELVEMFSYDRPISTCVRHSIERLVPSHSPTERLLALELAGDLIKNGRGGSVAKFRAAGIDGRVVEETLQCIRKASEDRSWVRAALSQLSPEEQIHLAYVSGIDLPKSVLDADLPRTICEKASEQGRAMIVVGELMRRHPRLPFDRVAAARSPGDES
ncbi:MAG: DUF4062 domain-containing protein [Armatimonadota bacterium]